MNQTLELIATDDVELGTVTRRWFKFGGEVYGLTSKGDVLDVDGKPINDTPAARAFLTKNKRLLAAFEALKILRDLPTKTPAISDTMGMADLFGVDYERLFALAREHL